MAPVARQADAAQRGQRQTRLVTPLGHRIAALGAVQACAIELGADLVRRELVDIGAVERQPDRADAVRAVGIARRGLDPLRGQRPCVDVGVDDEARIALPQRAVGIAVDRAAELVVGGLEALRDDRVRTDDADPVLQLDAEAVDRQVEARQERRPQDHARGERVGLFGAQVRVAAEQAVILLGRVGGDQAEPVRGNAGQRALRGRVAVDQPVDRGAGAGIGRTVELDRLLREQLLRVRCADRTVVAAAEADVGDRRPDQLTLVRMRRTRGAVARIAIAAIDRQLVDERAVADQRHLDFAEHFLDGVAAADRQRRAALAGQIAAQERVVDFEAQRFLAVLATDVQRDALARERRLHAVFGALEGEVRVEDGFLVLARLEARGLDIVQRLGRDPGRAEDVERDAVRIGAVDDRAADRLAERRRAGTRVGDRVERARGARDREFIAIHLAEHGAAELAIGLVRNALVDIAGRARDEAILGVAKIRLAPAALDVAPTDQDVRLLILRPVRVGQVDHRAIGVGHQVGRTAEGRDLRRRQQRVVAVQDPRVVEVTRRRDLRDRAIVHEHEVGIGLERVADFILGEEARGVARVRTLVIVQRVGVVERPPRDELACCVQRIAGRRPALGRIAEREVRRECGGRSAAHIIVADIARRRVQPARAIVARPLQDRADLAIAAIADDMAAAVAGGRADLEVDVELRAVECLAARRGIAACRRQRLEPLAAVVVVVDAARHVDAEAFVIGVEHEVDDAGDRVRPIDRTGAAGQHVDAFDQRGGDHVDVGGRTRGAARRGVARHQAAAVDQHQRARFTQVAQVDRRRTGRTVRHRRGLRRERRRQAVEHVLDARRAAQLDVRRVDHGDRAGGGQVGVRDARSGDDDVGTRGGPGCSGILARRVRDCRGRRCRAVVAGGALRCGSRLGCRCRSRCGLGRCRKRHDGACDHRGREQAVPKHMIPHVFIPLSRRRSVMTDAMCCGALRRTDWGPVTQTAALLSKIKL